MSSVDERRTAYLVTRAQVVASRELLSKCRNCHQKARQEPVRWRRWRKTNREDQKNQIPSSGAPVTLSPSRIFFIPYLYIRLRPPIGFFFFFFTWVTALTPSDDWSLPEGKEEKRAHSDACVCACSFGSACVSSGMRRMVCVIVKRALSWLWLLKENLFDDYVFMFLMMFRGRKKSFASTSDSEEGELW